MTQISSTIALDARLAEQAMPAQSVVMYQRWEDLLFLHWPVAPEVVAEILPPGLRVDTFDGQAWIGVVPFSMRAVRPRFLPAVKGLSHFPELNLRTYVVDEQGRPGVWFYSLDTPKRLANWIARTFFNLNYRLAQMHLHQQGACIKYSSKLWMGEEWDEPQKYEWERIGEATSASPGSLEFFLVERYRLFAYNQKTERLFTGSVHHAPYRVQSVTLSHYTKRLFELNGMAEPDGPPASVLASAGVDVRIYPMERV
jgi:uncharacterized protein YqjF (DUF2071 family)